MLRVGLGFDTHGFAGPEAKNRPLVLGGVVIPGERGLAGHSDADVLTHAICDAVLGALGLGDLGRHFPDTDPRLSGISSLVLLERVAAMMTREGYRLVNLDAVVIAQHPRIGPHADVMRRNIARALGVDGSAVNVKGTSPESLGSLGRGEGLASRAVVLLERI